MKKTWVLLHAHGTKSGERREAEAVRLFSFLKEYAKQPMAENSLPDTIDKS